MKSYMSISLWSIISIFFVGSAQAVVAPYYAHGDVSALDGLLSVIERDNLVSTGALNVAAGAQWWCEVPGCGISISPPASSAWAEVSVNPVTGTLGASAGSWRENQNGGYAEAYGYMSQVFSVGTDGTLGAGDPVSVDINMQLQGIIDSVSSFGNVQGMVLLNHYDPAFTYDNFDGTQLDHMPSWTFLDIFSNPAGSGLFPQLLGSVQHSASLPTELVNFSGSTSADVNVGDVLILETMLFVDNHLGFSENLGESWTNFQNTLNSSLTTTTPGATLNAVPVPAAVWLFGSGLIGLIAVARRKA